MAYKELIQRIDVGASGAVSLMFSNIPQTYTDLVVIFSGRSARNDTDGYPIIRLNNSTSGYSYRTIYSSGANSSGTSYSGTDRIHFGYTGGNNSTSNTFSYNYAYIPNYTSNSNKSILCDGITEENSTLAYLAVTANTWSNTSPITSLEIHEVTETIFVQYTTASLYGIKRGNYGLSGSLGGTITTSGGYTYHTFRGSDTLEVPNLITSAEMLVIGGGGAGGTGDAGGGGAGGLCYHPGFIIPRGSYPILVGAGGSGALESAEVTTATDSIAFGVTAFAGGYGGSYSNTYGQAGGSGGGGQGTNSGLTSVPGAATQTSNGGATGYGNAGGTGQVQIQWIGGGGGGAGEAGNTDGQGAGGDGLNTWSTWATATSTGVGGYYAGGGAGNGEYFSGSIEGGLGGGASSGGYYAVGVNGTANTGGGASGGGWSDGRRGGNGGSGIVIIRYLTPA